MALHLTAVDRAQSEPLMTSDESIGIVLRFRDLVTELGGTVSEHRRVLRQYGHAWWGWWYRQSECIPRNVLAVLFSGEPNVHVPILLFHSGTLELYVTYASRVVVAPSIVGISSPDYGITPQYYLRGRYPVWFRLAQDISPLDAKSVRIIGKPTLEPEADKMPEAGAGEDVPLSVLGTDRPTLWLFAQKNTNSKK